MTDLAARLRRDQLLQLRHVRLLELAGDTRALAHVARLAIEASYSRRLADAERGRSAAKARQRISDDELLDLMARQLAAHPGRSSSDLARAVLRRQAGKTAVTHDWVRKRIAALRKKVGSLSDTAEKPQTSVVESPAPGIVECIE